MNIREQALRDMIRYQAEIDEAQDNPELLHRSLDEINVDYHRALQEYHDTSVNSEDEYQAFQYVGDHPQRGTLVDDESLHENENQGFSPNNYYSGSARRIEGYAPTMELLGGINELETMIKNIQKLIEKQSLAIKQQKLEMELQHKMLLEMQQTLENLQDQAELMSRAFNILEDTNKDAATLLKLRNQAAEPAMIDNWLRLPVAWVWYATSDLFKKNRLLFQTILVLAFTFFTLWGIHLPNYTLQKPDLAAPVADISWMNEFHSRQADTVASLQEEVGKYEAAVAKLSKANDAAPLPSSLGAFTNLILGAATFAVPIAVIQNLGKIIAGSRRAFGR